MRSGPIRIQDRDLALVKDVFLHRVARRDDLIGLGHFASIPRCNQRLAQLVRAGWLRRIEIVNGLITQQGLYAPGTAAASFIQQSLDMPVEEVARCCTPHEGPLLVEHSLRVLDFRLQLEKEAEVSGIEIEEWLCEPECLHEFAYLPGRGAGWSSVVMKPDGFFRIGRCDAFFVEIDLGHVSLPRFEQKLKRFGSYRDSGAFTEAYDANGFSVLTVTVGERRLSHLAALPAGSFDHLVTSWRRLLSDGVFDCSWATCRVPEIRLVDVLNPVGLVNSR